MEDNTTCFSFTEDGKLCLDPYHSYYSISDDLYSGLLVFLLHPNIVVQCNWIHGIFTGEFIAVNVETRRVICILVLKDGSVIEKRNLSEIKMSKVIDIDPTGVRWEGSVLDCVPCGWGSLYDENNSLSYTGFLVNAEETCFGNQYYSDLCQVCYEGMICRNKRVGMGKLYDRNGSLVYSGVWINDDSMFPHSFTLPPNCDSLTGIHSQLEDLVIGNGCCSSFSVFPVFFLYCLCNLTVGDDSFSNCDLFILRNMDCLKSICIGNRSFSLVKEPGERKRRLNRVFSITACNQLESITIGSFSFADYASFEIQGMDYCFITIRSSSTDSTDCWRYH